MNNDLIERIARAIEEWLAAHDGEEIDCRALARIAVMRGEVGGLREATDEMVEAAFNATEAAYALSNHQIRTIYRAMVAAALTNKGANP